MQKLIRLSLSSGLFIILIFCPSSFAKTEELNSLSNKLESTFNNKKKIEFSNLFSKQISKDLEKKYRYFIKNFSNSKWTIKPSNNPIDNRQSIDVLITGEINTGIHKYSLISNQKLAIKTEKEKIIDIEILSEYSILQSGSNKIEITIQIPDTVLTGSKYDIDIILDKPLENRIIAGDLIAVDNN